MMFVVPNITLNPDTIHDYCQKWGIQELALFGSVLRDDFNDTSDIDVLVTFAENRHPTLFLMFEMTEELEAIFGRKVDIVTRASVETSENYIRRNEVLNTLKVIY